MNQKLDFTSFQNKFSKLSPTMIAWLAGLLQAESYLHEDKRLRSNSDNPPPPIPAIRLEMVEEDLMKYVGSLLDENVIETNRKTTAGKVVYRINVYSRKKVAPYFIGEKTVSLL